MIIAKPLKAGTVVAIKLIGGTADIVARLVDDYKGGDVVVRRPIEAHMVQGQQGGLGLAFAPFSLAAEDEQVFRFPRDKMLVDPFAARSEVTSTYNEQTTSLKLPG
jgi:hypothetical protein